MQETWTNQDGKEFLVEDLYNENCILMDLEKQPQFVKDIMFSTIDEALDNPGKFSHFHFLGFCGKYELKNITKFIDNFLPMLK